MTDTPEESAPRAPRVLLMRPDSRYLAAYGVRELGRLTGISPTTISRLKRGLETPSSFVLVAFGQTFPGATLEELAGFYSVGPEPAAMLAAVKAVAIAGGVPKRAKVVAKAKKRAKEGGRKKKREKPVKIGRN